MLQLEGEEPVLRTLALRSEIWIWLNFRMSAQVLPLPQEGFITNIPAMYIIMPF